MININKNIIKLIIITVLMFFIFPSTISNANTPSFTMNIFDSSKSTISVGVGEEFEVQFNLSDGLSNQKSICITLGYDSTKIEPVSEVIDGDAKIWDTNSLGGDVAENIIATQMNDGEIKISLFNLDESDINQSGIIGKIKFKAIENNNSSITFKDITYSTWDVEGDGTDEIDTSVASNSKVQVQKKSELPFVDVSVSKWSYETIKYCYENKLIYGTESNKFSPKQNLTRGMLVTILRRMDGNPKVDYELNFTDVKSNKYYYESVKWANKNKIIYGYKDNTFRPNNAITRQDMIVILRNYAKYKGIDTNISSDLTKYNDYNNIDSHAKSAMEWAVKVGLIYGSNNNLNPKNGATREEASAFIYRYCTQIRNE